jgi:hypothetical protein
MQDTQGGGVFAISSACHRRRRIAGVAGPCVSILRDFVNVSADAFLISIRAHSPGFGHNAASEAEILSVPDGAQVVLQARSKDLAGDPDSYGGVIASISKLSFGV